MLNWAGWHHRTLNPLNWTQFKLNPSYISTYANLCVLISLIFRSLQQTTFQISPWREKKIGQHVAEGALETFCKFYIFSKNLTASRPQSRMCCKVHFRQGLHVCPEESWNWKKNAFSHIIKTNSVLWGKILRRNTAGGWSGRGMRKGGRRRDMLSHMVTCTFPFQLRSRTSH